MKKREAEIQLLGYCSNDLEKLRKFIENFENHHRLVGEDKTAFFLLRNLYWEEKKYAKSVSYALRNYDINFDSLVKNFKAVIYF